MKFHPLKSSSFVVLAALLHSGQGHATPSGLNNIPTADTVPHRTVAVQIYDLFGEGPHDFASGFKTGWDFPGLELEWGLDSHLAPDPAGPLLFQTKLGFQPWQSGAFAMGVAGVALTDHDAAGDPFSYAMLAHDFGFARLSRRLRRIRPEWQHRAPRHRPHCGSSSGATSTSTPTSCRSATARPHHRRRPQV
jgi:hypothetical protein